MSKQNPIEIKITTYCAGGKTTLAIELMKFLRSKGFEGEVQDDDLDYKPEASFKFLDMKLTGIAERSYVTIKTVQLSKGSYLKHQKERNEH